MISGLNTTLSRRYQVCLIVIAVLALYYPAIFAEVSILDDREAITNLFNLDSFDIGSMFFPRATDGGYYRPFLGISYLIDRFWWFLDPHIMHFENILMHLANSLLVYAIGIKLCRRETGMLPLAGALLFALHPINTESINWISGRTDPMAGMFVLAALYFVLMYREQQRKMYLVAASVLTLCGIFSKETAFGFFIGAFFILSAEQEKKHNNLN
ncbi:MAG: glycosyltransferase family 39 protein [Geobacter sp.]